ncbi:MAG: hypothetical protein V9H26_24945 [Verrucomicrobiota bacterium]
MNLREFDRGVKLAHRLWNDRLSRWRPFARLRDGNVSFPCPFLVEDSLESSAPISIR